MASNNQISPGMTIKLEGKIYRVESSVKVTVGKAQPIIKTKLKDLITDDVIERSFKTTQEVQEVSLLEKKLEYLYLEGKDYLFLDAGSLDQVVVPSSVVGDKVSYLKEGTEVKSVFYGDAIFSVELPQFLELMVVKTEPLEKVSHVANADKLAVLETGAKIEVPMFVESGDIVKVDTYTNEYIQRV